MTRSLPTRPHRGVHRFVATTTLVVAGLGASLAPATASDVADGSADGDAPVAGAVCDQEDLASDVTIAGAAARVAQRAYTTHTRTAMRTLEVKLRRTEDQQARTAAAGARRAARDAAKAESKGGKGSDEAKTARAAARAAAATARTEVRQARQVRRAGHQQLVTLVKAERKRLKVQWDEASATFRSAVQASDDCEEMLADDPTDDPSDTGDSTGTDDGSGTSDVA